MLFFEFSNSMVQNNEVLARRFLNKELEPAQILNMSPNELKVPLFVFFVFFFFLELIF